MKHSLSFLLIFSIVISYSNAQTSAEIEARAEKHLADMAVPKVGGGSSIEITTTDSASLAQMIATTIFGGCVQVSNVTWSGSISAFGGFTDPNEVSGMGEGLIMSTGNVANIADAGSAFASTNNGTAGDPDMSIIAGVATMDAAVLEFDFIPTADTIFASQFVFGSEEYPEWVCSSFNDAFGFIISGGPNSIAGENVALIPGTSVPISINTVNQDTGCGGDFSSFYVANESSTDISLDGLTTLMPLEYPVVAGEVYHFKIVIADAGDAVYDSGILIRAQSFCGNYWFQSSEFVIQPQGGLTYFFNNQSDHSTDYLWDFGDGNTSTDISPTHTYSQPGDYTVSLTANNLCQSTSSDQNLNLLATDIDDPSFESLEVYAVDDNNIRIEYAGSASALLRFEILNTLGQTVDFHTIGISNALSRTYPLPTDVSGIYFLRFWAGNTAVMKKLVSRK